ncbi:MAG TPA: hypothetical protein VGN37_02605 [Actinocatenispora sp.]
MSVRRRVIVAAAGAVSLAAAALTAPSPASAASGPTALPASQYTLSANYHQYDTLNSSLVSLLGTAPVHEVMDNANHDRQSISSPGVAGYSDGFTYDSGDVGDCTNYPQGITTTRDAVGGDYDGHQLVVVSWYTKDGCDGGTTRSRITLVDWDATWPNKYRKVLLVQPTGTSSAPNFADIPIHAGGVSWYGDYLYVADTGHGMRVFDMRKILKTNTGGTADQIGRQSDGTTYYAHNYAYVLPQVGTISSATTSGTNLVWSTISLDRAVPSIVMAEYTCASGCTSYPNRPPRAVRFPFASGQTTFAASTTATEALQLPWYNINGVGSHNKRWWFNSSGASKLYYWTPASGPLTFAWISGGESLSYWEDASSADLLWSLRETKGNRPVFAVTQATYGP